jgi:hypothetical protein
MITDSRLQIAGRHAARPMAKEAVMSLSLSKRRAVRALLARAETRTLTV